MSDTVTFEVKGLEELTESFKKIATQYPDKAGELLQKEAKTLRREVVKMVNNDVNVDQESKRSLGKIKEYRISEIKGYNEKQYVEVSGVAPHFHLLENGHQIVTPKHRKIKLKDGSKKRITLANGGQNRGFYVGHHWMDRASKQVEKRLPQDVEAVVNKILEKEGFL